MLPGMAATERAGVLYRDSVGRCVGSHVVVLGGVQHISARWSCIAVGVLLAGRVRLAI